MTPKPVQLRVDHVKLFRNLPGLAFEGRIHEQILPALRDHEGDIVRLPAVVLHSGYDTSEEGQAGKRKRDYHLLALDLRERPNHPFVLFNCGMTDHYVGKHKRAIRFLRKSIANSGPSESHVRKAYVFLAVSLRIMGDLDSSLIALREGLAITPEDPELLFQLAYTLQSLRRLDQAKECYLRTLSAKVDDHFSSIDVSILSYKSMHNLGNIELDLGCYEAARSWWIKAIEVAPHFMPSIEVLFHCALERRDLEMAVWSLQAAATANALSSCVERMQRALFDVARALEQSLAGLKGSMNGHVHQSGSLSQAKHLLASGKEEEALPNLKALAGEGVAEAAYYLGVHSVRTGQLGQALVWMEKARELNPSHEPTKEQVSRLKEALLNGKG